MPTYEYACKSCGEHQEVVQSFKDEPLTKCPACGGPLRKVFGSIGIAFKGSGFYRNDSRPAASSSDKASSDKATSDKGSSDKASPDKASSDKATSDKGASEKGPSSAPSSDKGGSSASKGDSKPATSSAS
jgi:putative FmdB family regulatory protein